MAHIVFIFELSSIGYVYFEKKLFHFFDKSFKDRFFFLYNKNWKILERSS